MHSIENEFLRVSAREYGAELVSVYDKRNKLERLWQANADVWGWHAPTLFPVVGRCLDDEIIVDGRKHKMEKHGFVRKSDFTLLALSEDKMVFMLKYDTETLKYYPYKFEFLIAYQLNGHELKVSYEVLNKDDKDIWFQVGGHPAFAVPLLAGEKYEDYYLEFEHYETADRHLINEDGFFDGRRENVLKDSNIIALKPDLFNQDALIFKDLKSRKISLKSAKNPRFLSLEFSKFNYLGLWAKPNSSFVCIEPWLGCADNVGKTVEMPQKEGVMSVASAEAYVVSYKITIG